MTVSVVMDSAICGRYHVPQNVFLVLEIFLRYCRIEQRSNAAGQRYTKRNRFTLISLSRAFGVARRLDRNCFRFRSACVRRFYPRGVPRDRATTAPPVDRPAFQLAAANLRVILVCSRRFPLRATGGKSVAPSTPSYPFVY